MNYSNQTVLITGGTGSFGKKVATYLDGKNPERIIIFSRDEKKQHEMQLEYPHFKYVIGDVRDRESLKQVMQGVDTVFHAAAMKQVPSCEINPYEAVKTNINGSINVCDSALEANVSKVVGLSTDKAVKPINTMGMTKAIMEKIITSQNMQQVDTIFCCVRYGNVMASRGSVIPLFYNQIMSGSKVTITDPSMTRFLLTLDQSVELVQRAIEFSTGGEIFVKKAPACSVLDLAKTMIRKYGDGDLERIEVLGTRSGEKIHEVLLNEYEVTRAEEHDDYFHISAEYSSKKKILNSNFSNGEEYTSFNTRQCVSYDEISLLLDKVGVEDVASNRS